jgi:triacylglycerol lipase
MKLRVLAGLAAAAMVVVGAIGGGPARAASTHYPVGYDFLENTMKAGTSASAPGENIWSCKPTAAHPRPVVLVHGTGGNAATNWVTYAALLANRGYCVFALTYGVVPLEAASPVKFGGIGEIRASAQQLKAFVARVLRATGASKVDLIGHSQGTLMPNYYVRFLGGAPYVDHYVSLAPLWHGEGPDLLGQLNAAGTAYGLTSDNLVPVCAACGEMANGSAFMQQMRAGRIAAKGVQYTNIFTRYDDVVIPYTSGIQTGYPNMKNVLLQSVCPNDFSDHLEIASSPNAAQIVLNTLDPAHATPVKCRLTLPVNGFVH